MTSLQTRYSNSLTPADTFASCLHPAPFVDMGARPDDWCSRRAGLSFPGCLLVNENRQPNDVTTPRPNPNARWTCGYLHLGMSCTEGPTENGVCCQLNRAKESATEGCNPQSCDHACGSQGECQQTQSKLHEEMQTLQALGPCVPLRTSWFSRQTLALNAAILAGGLLLLAMALPQREATFVPAINQHPNTRPLPPL